VQTRHGILLVVVVIAGVVAAPTAAGQTADDDSYFDALIASDTSGDQGLLSSVTERAGRLFIEVSSGVNRLQARYLSAVPVIGDDTTGNATQYASTVTETFNANNGTIQSYVNARVAADRDHDVFAVYFSDREGGNVTRYVVSTVHNGSYHDLRMLTPAEFDNTNRAVEHHVVLDWYASQHANRELDTFVSEYASPSKDLTTSYKARMITEYGGGIQSSLWNDSGGA
jgi:hypothetical protein